MTDSVSQNNDHVFFELRFFFFSPLKIETYPNAITPNVFQACGCVDS